MISFLFNIIGFVVTGLVGSVIMLLLLLFLMRLLYPRASVTASPVSVLMLTGLFLFLVVQLFLLSGAVYAGKQVSKVEKELVAFVEANRAIVDRSSEGISRLRIEVADEYPFLESYMKKVSDDDLRVFLNEPGSLLRPLIHAYLWRRIAWIAGMFLLVGGFLVYRAEGEQRRYNYLRNRSIMNL